MKQSNLHLRHLELIQRQKLKGFVINVREKVLVANHIHATNIINQGINLLQVFEMKC